MNSGSVMNLKLPYSFSRPALGLHRQRGTSLSISASRRVYHYRTLDAVVLDRYQNHANVVFHSRGELSRMRLLPDVSSNSDESV